MKLAGRLCVWVGAALLIIGMTVHQVAFGNLWDLSTREAVLVLLLALAAVTLTVLTLFFDRPLLVVIAAGIGVYLFGQYFPLGGSYSYYKGGFWIAVVGSLTMAVGGGLSLAAIWPARGWRPVTGFGADLGLSPAGSDGPGRAAEALPPAGWYADPSGQGGRRYWSGSAWTEHRA